MDKNQIIEGLCMQNPESLYERANAIRSEYMGDSVHIRVIIEFSNYCRRNCLYCGLRKSNHLVTRYRMTPEEIIDTCRAAHELGFKTVVLQSGEDELFAIEDLANIVHTIKQKFGLAITLSIGEKSYDEYRMLRDAGTDRYLMRIETSNRNLFKRMKPDSSFDERYKRLLWLKELGYQVGSGHIVGLPGQTPEIIADDILLFDELDLDMIGIGPFIPHQDTPLAGCIAGDLEMTLKALALIRIVTRNAHMPATTALGSIDPEGRQKGLRVGANVIMPNMTPERFRRLYEIYPNKVCVDENPMDSYKIVESIVRSVGRYIADDYGHTMKKRQA